MPGSAASASTLPPPALAAGLFFRALLPSSAKEGEGKLKQKQTNKKHKKLQKIWSKSLLPFSLVRCMTIANIKDKQVRPR